MNIQDTANDHLSFVKCRFVTKTGCERGRPSSKFSLEWQKAKKQCAEFKYAHMLSLIFPSLLPRILIKRNRRANCISGANAAN
jgi:hypothetical protein